MKIYNHMLKQLMGKRRLIQGILAVLIYAAVSWLGLPLLYILAGGVALGLLCDEACYISSLNGEYSHFRHGKKRPGSAYSCSRCLACVSSCPRDSLKYSLDI